MLVESHYDRHAGPPHAPRLITGTPCAPELRRSLPMRQDRSPAHAIFRLAPALRPLGAGVLLCAKRSGLASLSAALPCEAVEGGLDASGDWRSGFNIHFRLDAGLAAMVARGDGRCRCCRATGSSHPARSVFEMLEPWSPTVRVATAVA